MLFLIMMYTTQLQAAPTAVSPAPPSAPTPRPVAAAIIPIAPPTANVDAGVSTTPIAPQPGLAPAAGALTTAVVMPPVHTAAELFALAKPLVFKLDTRLRGSHAEREHGTGFVVGVDGRLATNYHVVADVILEPNKYELLARGADGEMAARVIEIDPVNDIALVKIERTFPAALVVGPAVPAQVGDALFAIGFPKSEDMTIAQGNFNGERMIGFAPVIASSLPLNPGMSGGPCLDRFGNVVGVNRAIQREAQNISYLSPNSALQALIDRAAKTPVTANADWSARIVKDVTARETASLAKPVAGERQRLGSIGFTTPVANTRCGQDKVDGLVTRDQEMLICQSVSMALLTPEQNALQITTVGGSSPHGDPPAAFRALNDAYQRAQKARAKSTRSLASMDQPAPKTVCRAKALRTTSNLDVTVRWCSVEVPQFNGLYDTYAKINVRGADHRATAFAQGYEGMSLGATGAYLQRFVEGMRNEP